MYAQPLPNNADRARWASSLMMINFCLFSFLLLRDIVKLVAEGTFYSYYRIAMLGDAVLDLLGSLMIIVTCVFFIMWFRRAYNNLYIAGARFLPYKEGWAAGGWFVPIAHWIIPYRIMNAIWTETPAAIRKVGEQYEKQEGNIGGWWALWVIGNLASSIQSQMITNGGVPVTDVSITVLDIISDGCLLAAAWMAMKIIKAIAEMEVDLQRRYNEWLAYQTQQHAQQFEKQQSFNPAQNTGASMPPPVPPPPPMQKW